MNFTSTARPNANATTTMQGNYFTHAPPFLISPLDGLARLRVISDGRFAVQLNHFMPGLLS
jgi:hypothetical protein